MEVTIKINSIRELNRIRKIFEDEKIQIVVDKHRKRQTISKVNKITDRVFKKTDKGEELVVCKNVDDFFKKLGI